MTKTLREKCPYLQFFWSVFPCIRTEYGKIRSISVRIQSECGKIQTRKTPNMDTFHSVKILISANFRETWHWHLIFFKLLHKLLYFCSKFQISSIIRVDMVVLTPGKPNTNCKDLNQNKVKNNVNIVKRQIRDIWAKFDDINIEFGHASNWVYF